MKTDITIYYLSFSFAPLFIMKVYHDINDLPDFTNAVITIGTFDGVHNGHRQIIEQLKQEAANINGSSVVITFYPHPRQIVGNPSSQIFILNTLNEKIKLLSEAGVQNLIIVPFTQTFAEMTAASYISDFLVKCFHPHTIIIGYDHKFGHNRIGNFELLERMSSVFNFRVKEIPEQLLHDITISSTKIRNKLSEGDIATANELLGYTYFFSGFVVHGNQLGRTIGFPTANINLDDAQKLIPGNGVYAVEVIIDHSKKLLKGMMNIGVRPTFNQTQRVIEVNIFDFDELIYGKEITVMVKIKMRDEIKFEGIDALKEQLNKDKFMAMTL